MSNNFSDDVGINLIKNIELGFYDKICNSCVSLN